MMIRTAELKDACHIKEIALNLSHLYLLKSEPDLPQWLSLSLELKQFKSRISDPSFLTLVYELQGEIVGFITLQDKIHIYHLFIAEKSQRKGIATKLWAKAKDFYPTRKFTVRSSLFAIPMYEKFGFKKTSPVLRKDNVQFQSMELTK